MSVLEDKLDKAIPKRPKWMEELESGDYSPEKAELLSRRAIISFRRREFLFFFCGGGMGDFITLAFGLPADAEVLNVFEDAWTSEICLVVWSSQFAPVAEGERLPQHHLLPCRVGNFFSTMYNLVDACEKSGMENDALTTARTLLNHIGEAKQCLESNQADKAEVLPVAIGVGHSRDCICNDCVKVRIG